MAFVPDDVTWKHKISMHDVRGPKGKWKQKEVNNIVELTNFITSSIVSAEIIPHTNTNVSLHILSTNPKLLLHCSHLIAVVVNS